MMLEETTDYPWNEIFTPTVEILETLMALSLGFLFVGILAWIYKSMFPKGMISYFFDPRPKPRKPRRSRWEIIQARAKENSQEWGKKDSVSSDMRKAEDPLAFWRSLTDDEVH